MKYTSTLLGKYQNFFFFFLNDLYPPSENRSKMEIQKKLTVLQEQSKLEPGNKNFYVQNNLKTSKKSFLVPI